MKKTVSVCMMCLVCLVFTTGCWDRTELNDMAIILGWGMDITKDGTLLDTAEIAIPSKLGHEQNSGDGKGYLVETATGEDVLDAAQNMQAKVSRTWFASHRRVGLIGEDLARHGIKDILDTWSRDPIIRLRTDMLVVKGGQARDVFSASSSLEAIPSLGVLKEHKAVGGPGDTAFLSFLMAATTEGSSATLPAIEVDQGTNGENKRFQITGTAIFNKDLKLVGFLNMKEGFIQQWVVGHMKKQTLTVAIPSDLKKDISLDMIKLGSKIRPVIHRDHVDFDITLTGKGIVKENNTRLDLSKAKNLKLLETALDKETERDAFQTITQVQQMYGTDIFGFGEAVHQKYPLRWKALKKNWQQTFREAKLSVHADLTVKRTGLTGAPMQLKESEIQK